MKRILVILTMLTSFIQAEISAPKSGCILSQEGEVTVGWKAYKTSAKIGVSGGFNDVSYTAAAKEGKNFKGILVGSTVIINTNSVNSKNEGRDLKLLNSFFKILSDEKITAKIVDIKTKSKEMGKPKTGTLMVDIIMNGITKLSPINYIYDKGIMRGEGFIDLFDFGASKALTSINKACFDLHEGKTWSDVSIEFRMNIKATLCDAKTP